MRQVDRQPVHRLDGCERRFDVAWNAEVAAVHMQGVRDADLGQAARQVEEDLAGRQAIVAVLLVEVELALVELES
jgi:hypothetical protein